MSGKLDFSSIRVFLFDLDGVLAVGKERRRYLGGRHLVERLKRSGRRVFVLTNDSTHTRGELQMSLGKLGFAFDRGEVLTSSYLTAIYLNERFGRASFFLVGERGFRRELEAIGHYQGAKPQVVVVGLDRQLTYKKLDDALRYLRAGAELVGSYGAALYMGAAGPALSAGPIIRALEYASEREAVMVGKPSPRMYKLALGLAGERPGRAVMVGDQIESDISGARKAGVHTVLVLTGVETKETLRSSKIKPELVVKNVDVIEKLL